MPINRASCSQSRRVAFICSFILTFDRLLPGIFAALSVMLAALVGSRLDVALAIGLLRGPGAHSNIEDHQMPLGVVL